MFYYNDRLVVSHALLDDWCHRWGHCHSALGSLVDYYKKRRDVECSDQSLLNCFYAALTPLATEDSLNCYRCGYTLKILIFDGNSKARIDVSYVDMSGLDQFDGYINSRM